MGWLSSFFSNPVNTLFDTAAKIPGSPEAGMQGIYGGLNGDLSWDPYSPENSVWDMGAGGTELSQDPENRKIGRTIGTAIGSYFTGGLLSGAMGSAAGGAANAALWSGAQGARGNDLWRAAASGGLSGAMPDVAGYAGVDDYDLARAVNGGVRGATGAALNNGNVGVGAITGAAPGLASYGGGQYSNAMSENPFGQNYSPTPGYSTSGSFGKELTSTPQSTAPWSSSYVGADTPNGPQERASALNANSTFENPAFGQFFNQLMPDSAQGWGDLAQGLMGMYMGHRQRKDAKEMMRSYGGNRSAYGQQLQKNLQRRDAAAGRRSDYGGREVELQAKLAELDSRNAPLMSQLSQQKLMGLANMFQSGLRYGGKSGAFGSQYNPNVPQQPVSMGGMLPSTWTQPQPSNMDLNFDPNQGRNRYRLGGS